MGHSRRVSQKHLQLIASPCRLVPWQIASQRLHLMQSPILMADMPEAKKTCNLRCSMVIIILKRAFTIIILLVLGAKVVPAQQQLTLRHATRR